MKYDVAFELTEISRIHYYAGFGVFVGLFVIAFSVFWGTFGTASHTTIWRPIVSLLFSGVFLFISIHIFVGTTQMIHQIYGSYSRGEAQVVEGVVERCDTEYFYRNGRGTFSVNDVTFDYGHTTGIPGYRGKNNLIHTNGQLVKIHYVSYSNQNIIVKIELCN